MGSCLKGNYLLGNEWILHSSTRICGLYAINTKAVKVWGVGGKRHGTSNIKTGLGVLWFSPALGSSKSVVDVSQDHWTQDYFPTKMSLTKHDHNTPKILHSYLLILTGKIEKKLKNNKSNALEWYEKKEWWLLYLCVYLKELFISACHLLSLVITQGKFQETPMCDRNLKSYRPPINSMLKRYIWLIFVILLIDLTY